MGMNDMNLLGEQSRRHFLKTSALLGLTAASASTMIGRAFAQEAAKKGGTLKIGMRGGSTTDTLKPLAAETNGLVTRVASAGGGIDLPPILPVRGVVRSADPGRMAIRMTDETVLKGIDTLPLFAGFLGVAILLFAFASMWWREGR